MYKTVDEYITYKNREIKGMYNKSYINLIHKSFNDNIEKILSYMKQYNGREINEENIIYDVKEFYNRIINIDVKSNKNILIENKIMSLLSSTNEEELTFYIKLYFEITNDIAPSIKKYIIQRNCLNDLTQYIKVNYYNLQTFIESNIIENKYRLFEKYKLEELENEKYKSNILFDFIFLTTFLSILSESKIVSYDLETNSFLDCRRLNSGQIAQFGCINLLGSILEDEIDYKILDIINEYTTVSFIDEEASKVNGLTMEFLEKNKTIEIRDLHKKIKSLLNNNIVIGYNNRNFDDKILINLGDNIEKLNPYEFISIDVFIIVKNILQKSKKKLTNVVNRYNLGDKINEVLKEYKNHHNVNNFDRSHDAVYDSLATLFIFKKMIDNMLIKNNCKYYFL